jgi:FxsC-like protein
VRRTDSERTGTGQRGNYFYLSYAQSPPLAGTVQAGPDQWVREFYRDLAVAVREQASPDSDLGPGLYDQEIPLDSWRASLTEALSRAEVFVPLYSPGYFARSWPGREWACFERRLREAHVDNPLRRFRPVLWTPLPWDVDPPDLTELMADAEREYAENGLRTLLRLQPYRPTYERIVRRLAAQIVDLADNFPIGPSPAPDIDTVQSPFQAEAYGAVFAITMAVPRIFDLPRDMDRSGYGESRKDWKPYPGDQQAPLTEHAASIVERMDLAVMVTSIEKKRGDKLTSRPGVIIIDPWFIGTARGLADLQSFVTNLPPWVLPMVVLGASRDARSAELAEQVRAILRASGGHGEAAQRAIAGIDSLAMFAALMPILVAEAERQYLRHGFEAQRSRARVGRPRPAANLLNDSRAASDPPADRF